MIPRVKKSPVLAAPGGATQNSGRRLVSSFECITKVPPLSSPPQAPTGDDAPRLMREAHDRYDAAIARRCYDEAARHEADYQAAFDVRKSEILRRAAGRGPNGQA